MTSMTAHAPRTQGLEWLAQDARYTLDASGKVLAGKILTSTAETLGSTGIGIVPLAISGSSKLAVDVYEAGSELAANITTAQYAPSTDTGRSSYGTGSYWTNQAASGTIAFGDINDMTEDVNYAVTNSFGALLAFRSTAASLVGKRILRVSVKYRWTSNGLGDAAAVLVIGGVNYLGPTQTVTGVVGGFIGVMSNGQADWDLNPATGNPWTLAEANALINSSANSFGIMPGVSLGCPPTFTVSGFALSVIYCDENRVLTGTVASASLAVNTLANITPATPTGGTTYAKAAKDLTVMVRRISGYGSVTLAALDSGQTEAGVGYGYQPTLVGSSSGISEVAGAVSALGSPITRLPQILLGTSTAATYSVDSIAYQREEHSTNANLLYGARLMTQEITPTAAGTFVVLRALVALVVDDVSTPDLSIKIKRRSDNVQFGSTVTIRATDLDAPRTTPQTVTAILSSGATLVSGTQYYVEFSCASGTVALCWAIPYLTTGTTSAGVVARSYGGTTDRAMLADAVEYDAIDLPVYIGAQPAAPSGFIGLLI